MHFFSRPTQQQQRQQPQHVQQQQSQNVPPALLPSPPSPPPRPPRQQLSEWSSPAIRRGGYACQDFMLGAGMVIFQPATHRIVVVLDTRTQQWFFPRGRKDLGESLEQTALREAYEESGYRVEFMPLWSVVHAPAPPGREDAYRRPNREPIYVSLQSWPMKFDARGEVRDNGGEYFITWYIGQIAADAVHEVGTGMPDEQNYTSHLLSFDDAWSKLKNSSEGAVLSYAWEVYTRTFKVNQEIAQRRAQREAGAHSVSSASGSFEYANAERR